MRAEVVSGQAVTTPATSEASARGERPLWQVALAAWLGQRLLIGALVVGWQLELHTLTTAHFLRAFWPFDSVFYFEIAGAGYQTVPQAAYFPLYPLLMHLAAPLVGGNVAVAGAILSNACALAAFILLAKLVAAEFGPAAARRTLLYYALFPTGFFFAAIYTEGLFLLLSVAAFLAMRRQRWLLAGVLIALATLTRAQGALLLLPLAFETWRALRVQWPALNGAQRLRVALSPGAALSVAPLALVAFEGYLALIYGTPFALGRAMSSDGWQRHLDWPWAGTLADLSYLRSNGLHGLALEVVKNLLFVACWLTLTLIMLLPARLISTPRLPAAWIIYGCASLLQALALPAHFPGEGLMSTPRYMLVVFPCFAVLALLSKRYPRAHLLLFTVCVLALIVATRMLAVGILVG